MTVQDGALVAAALMPTADTILQLDRKIARAIQKEKGITLKAAELDLLTLVGAVELLGKARSEIMKEIAQCRNQRDYTAEVNSISTTSAAKVVRRPVRTSTSAGTMRQPDAFSDAARAHLIFG